MSGVMHVFFKVERFKDTTELIKITRYQQVVREKDKFRS